MSLVEEKEKIDKLQENLEQMTPAQREVVTAYISGIKVGAALGNEETVKAAG